MAIFGTGQPKYVTSGAETVNLDYAVILKDEPVWDIVEHEDEISLDRDIIGRGYHYEFTVQLHLWKYADPRAQFETIYNDLNTQVTLYRHRDDDPINDSNGDPVDFFITEVYPVEFNTPNRHDALIVKFESEIFTDLSQ